mmetsp:Transcript_10680/g.27754  ORF Transcript_10680/g.27754 Transcript_10680/m.27754 type:complete len:325 (+) Transcript_10680:70-1044(+)
MPGVVRLRLRLPVGQSVMAAEENITVAGLRALIEQETAIPASRMELLSGFPPSKLQDDHCIKDGETIIVREDASAATVPPPPSNDASMGGPSPPAENDTQDIRAINLARDPEPDATGSQPGASSEGVAVRKVIPADNNCLFAAIIHTAQLSMAPQALREVVKRRVLEDPSEYNEGVLGMPVEKYVEWITCPDHWGGEIELSILSKHLQKEIVAFDIISQRCLRYGEGQYNELIALLYDGIHYDAIIVLPFAGAPEEFAATQFASTDEHVISLAKQLQAEAHRQRQFTDTAKFSLRCLVCQAGLVGERGAQEHAKATGHMNFSEY